MCNQNRNRSKTAEILFKRNFQTRSAGLYNSTPVTENDLSWADVVIVMENEQRSEIGRRFPRMYLQKQIISLDIPDIYKSDDPKLVTELQTKIAACHLL